MPFMLANIAFALFGPPTSEKDVDKNVTPDIQVSSEKSENISEKKENTSDKNENISEKRENTSETNEKNSEKRKNTSDENISTFLQGYTSEQRENAMQVFNKIKEQSMVIIKLCFMNRRAVCLCAIFYKTTEWILY